MEISTIIIISIIVVLLLFFFWWKNRIAALEPPLHRDYIEISPANQNKPNYADVFRISSYNILADNVSFRIISQCPYKFLHFKYRSRRIVEEIENYKPDIFCLQEVDHFRKFYKPEFTKIGYSTIINKRKRCCRHGVVIGFLEAKYQLLKSNNVDFNDIDPDDKFYRTNSAAIISLITHRQSNKLLVISSVHTWFANKVIIYAQVAFLLYKIEEFIAKNKENYKELNNEDTPIIIGGDFNASPESNPIRFMQKQSPLIYENMNPEDKRRTVHIWHNFQNNFNLNSAYENYKFHKGEPMYNSNAHPEYTLVKSFCSKKYKACLDYLWYNKQALDLIKVLEIPDEDAIAQKGLPGLPNSLLSSDHIRIEAEFGIKENSNI